MSGPLNGACRPLTGTGITSSGSGRDCSEDQVFIKGGTCVGQAQVSSGDEVEGEGVMEGKKWGVNKLA